ncbi:ABC transporter substrate-binding protein [Streptomyces sp. NPDC004629]|uniref:ABC transporter substrate-binding protein n=1 Tax=Streptomyces sp. NPDC004629 TaxID=3364705 RepID=UPI0036D14E0E
MNNDRPIHPALSRRGFLAGTGALGAVGLLAATGCSTTPTGTAGAATESDTINFYSNVLGEEAQKGAWETVIHGWERKSGHKIKPVVYPYDQASTQLVLAARSGNFAGVGQGSWQALVPTGVLADVSDLVRGMDVPHDVLDSFRLNGKLYVVPTVSAGIGLVADGRLAAEFDLRQGMSTDEFADALAAVKKQDPDTIPYAAVTKNPDLKDAVHWMWVWGSPVVTPDLKCTIGDAESVAAMTWYKQLLDEGLIKAGVARSDARILFARGQTAMYDDAPLADTFLKTNGGSTELRANITALERPHVDGKPSCNRWWGGGLFCSAGKGEKTSKDFIRYVATDVGAETALYKQSATPPADKKVASQIPGLADDKFQTAFRGAVSEKSRAAAWDKLATAALIDTTIGEGIASILAGQVGVQRGLNDLRRQVQQKLDQKQ